MIVNALGEDRLGIVSDLTKCVSAAGGSVGESQATKLGAYFSLTMTIDVPTKSVSDIKAALKDIKGLKTQYLEASEDIAAPRKKPPRVAYSGRFTLEGLDNPGLVHTLTNFMVSHGLSVDTLETSQEEAAFGGTTLFSIDGIVTAHEPLPHSFDTDKIREELSKLGDSLNCDIDLEDNVTRKNRSSNYEIWENMA